MNLTPFDDLFKRAKFAATVMDGKTPVSSPSYQVALHFVQQLGCQTAFVIARGQVDELRKLADALEQYQHCDKLDRLLLDLPSTWKISTRDILRQPGIKAYHRQVRRRAKKLGVELNRESGRPKKK